MQANTAEVNVRVAVRVRPLLPKEKIAGESSCIKVMPSTRQLILGKDRTFTFDYVLSSKISQDVVYDTCVDSLVQSCFEGYNATVFAYGQTGSGKTYTVGGDNITSQTEVEFGVVPRAVKHVFSHIQSCQTREFTVKVSYIEIYKEELRDLLDVDTTSKDLHIREDDKGNTLIVGVSEVECETMEEVISHLEQGSSYRHTGSTQMNEHSSRSHSIFTICIEQRWTDIDGSGGERKRSRRESDTSEIILEENGEIEHYVCAKFHFVDLAGSERAHRTGNVGDRFKESVHINSGLLALGNVISALGDIKRKVTHIPYRDSKITRLLKDSLGGNAKTVMICCISPSSTNFDESLNALKYANRARNIKNKPIVNRDPQSIRFEEMQTEIRALREELQRQRTSLISGTPADSDLHKAIQDTGQIKTLEDKIIRLQTECSHYKMISEDAYKQLTDIQSRGTMTQSQAIRLSDWLDLMEEIKNKVPSTLNRDVLDNQTIVKLEQELNQCRNDLRSDEEIFAEKVKEVTLLQDRISELEDAATDYQTQVEQLQEKLHHQEQQMVDKQVQLEDLQLKYKEGEQRELLIDSSMDISSGPPTTTRRAKSVPAEFLGDRSLHKEEATRNIHTSPALFSLDRVMQSFRARSQLLVCRLEDTDDVLKPNFSEDDGVFEDTDDDTDDIIIGKTKSGQNDSQATTSGFDRAAQARGTYRVRRPKVRQAVLSAGDDAGSQPPGREHQLRKSQTDDEKLFSIKQIDPSKKSRRNRTLSKNAFGKTMPKADSEKKLKQTEIEVRQSTRNMRDLSINIKMKEQLIKELVKTGKDAKIMNKQYEERIVSLEHEKQEARADLAALQGALHDLESRGQHDKVEKEKLQLEFRKKMELAKNRIHLLQNKQKETERMAVVTGQTDKRIGDLELAIEKMRHQQDNLQKRLKEETERKVKIERDMQKELQRVKELEIRNEQQQKVLRVKTEEVTAMQRRLRSATHGTHTSGDDQSRINDQKRYLDQQVEKVLEQRRQMEELEKELEKREDIIAKKEAMMAEKSELQIKKLRSSQVLNKDIIMVTNKIGAMDRKIDEKAQEVLETPRGEGQGRVKDELSKLQHGRNRLNKQRQILDAKLHEGSILTPQEERRVIELDEALDALDAAIEYRNEIIQNKQQEIRKSTSTAQSGDENFLSRIKALSLTETKSLLAKYFEKVIDLRDSERKKDLEYSQLEMRVEEQDRLSQELESSLQRSRMDADRQLTLQQQAHERKIQLLMQQITDSNQPAADNHRSTATNHRSPATDKPEHDKDAKIQQLEKDLYYYKKTSRDTKKKLRELAAKTGGSTESDKGSECGESLENMTTPRDISARNLTPRSTPSPSSTRNGEQAMIQPTPPTGTEWDRLGPVRDGVPGGATAPVRISRKDLRRMSQEEIKLRKSAAEIIDTPRDSLDGGTNPWT